MCEHEAQSVDRNLLKAVIGYVRHINPLFSRCFYSDIVNVDAISGHNAAVSQLLKIAGTPADVADLCEIGQHLALNAQILEIVVRYHDHIVAHTPSSNGD